MRLTVSAWNDGLRVATNEFSALRNDYFLKIEVSDTGKDSPDRKAPIWGWKILIHLADGE